MSCMQDKAALLAGMEPDAVARLLACMDPNEAVLLLSALGDNTSKLVSNHLTTEDRDRLVEVRTVGNSRGMARMLLVALSAIL